MPVKEIKGFKVLLVELPNSTTAHSILFKTHEERGSDNAESRSIFLGNLPIGTTTKVIKKYFQAVAIGSTIERFVPSRLTDCSEDVWINLYKLTSDLDLYEDDAGAKLPKYCGIVTFVDKAAYKIAMKALKDLSSSGKTTKWPLSPNEFGSAHFLQQFKSRILDVDTLKADVAEAIGNFDRAEKESMEALQAQTELVDEDGFTLVVGSQRKTKSGIMGQQKLAATVEAEKAQHKMKKKEKQDFYRFQLRERKKEEMNELLRKFKADQEKVRTMKEKKRFKPY